MNTMKLFLAFVIILVLGFFAVGFTGSVTAPAANTTAGQQYTNLSMATGIANTGISAILLILMAAIVISAMFFLAKYVR